MQIIRIIFQWLARIIFIIAIIIAAFWIRTNYISELHFFNKPADKVKSVVPENPKDVTYQWRYNNTQYTIKETLYGSLYDFYRGSQKGYRYQGELPANWENDFYGMFLERVSNDNLIFEIAQNRPPGAIEIIIHPLPISAFAPAMMGQRHLHLPILQLIEQQDDNGINPAQIPE